MSARIEKAVENLGQSLKSLIKAYEREGHTLSLEKHQVLWQYLANLFNNASQQAESARVLSRTQPGQFSIADLTPQAVSELALPASAPIKAPARPEPEGRLVGQKRKPPSDDVDFIDDK